MKFKDLIVEKVYYRNLKKTDWQKFQMLLRNVPTAAKIPDTIEELEEMLDDWSLKLNRPWKLHVQ